MAVAVHQPVFLHLFFYKREVVAEQEKTAKIYTHMERERK